MNDMNDHLDATSEITLDVVKKRAIRGVAALTGRTIFLQILGLVATFFLTVFLDPKQFGVFFVVSAAVNFFAYFSDIGLAAALIQKKDLGKKELETTFTVQNSLVLILVLIIFLATPLYKQWYHLDQESIYLLWALAISLLLSSLKSIPSVLLERKLDFNKLVIPQIVESILYQGIVVFLAWKGFGITSFIVAVLVRGVAGLVIMYILQPWKPGIAFDMRALKDLLRFGLPYQLNTFLAVAKDDGMTAVLGGILGPANIGLLGWAQKWATAPLRFFMDQVIKVTFPAFSRMQEHKEELSKAVSKSIFFICLLVFPALISLVFLSPILVSLIPRYGKWQPALLALSLISINSAWAAITTPLTNVLNATGRIKITFKLMVMWTILTWVFVPGLSYLYGVNGAALGYALVGTSSIVAILVAVKSIKINLWESAGKPFIGALIMALTFIILRRFLPTSWVTVFILLLASLIAYAVSIYVLVGSSLVIDAKKMMPKFGGKMAIVVALCLLSVSLFPNKTFAAQNSFVTIVNPIRGSDFWDASQKPVDAVNGQMIITKELDVPVTWLIRFDAMKDNEILNALKYLAPSNEKGLFLEITPTWAKEAGVEYRQSKVWHNAGSVFLTGYLPVEREKFINSAFEEFKSAFGYYPKSVGSWWIDSYSLAYMQKKYGITSGLIVADQYTTDNYQIWGQYWSTPYYPSNKNTLNPAQSVENKLPVVMMQWAARDPVNGYGGQVIESTYSVQPNDYIDYHSLGSNYFSALIDIFMDQKFNKFNQIVVGLENSYPWDKYKEEYKKQIQILADKRSKGQLQLATMKDFSAWYQASFPAISPEHVIVSKDPLGSDKMSVWFMNPYYRAGWFYNKDGSVFRDVRQYIEGQEEPCLKVACTSLNFATFSTRVLDDITYGKTAILDQGKISQFEVIRKDQNLSIGYLNEAGRKREIEFLPRDLSIDGKMKTIDEFILQAVNIQPEKKQKNINGDPKLFAAYQETITGVITKTIKFILFVLVVLFIPGYLLVRSLKQKSLSFNIFVSICSGVVNLTLLAFLAGYIKMPWLVYVYIAISFMFFLYKKIYKEIPINFNSLSLVKKYWPFILIIILGTIFQSLALMKSGWIYDYGVGFWGPLGHDGIWHQALINQLIKQVPPENPAFSGSILNNYHYFYDLLVAVTFRLSQIPVLDLIYRFYPIFFSLGLGVGTFAIIFSLFKNRIMAFVSLYFVYFAGSFGWIVEYLKEKHFGGESAFWANQPVSMNLNPPFAISLLLILAIILVIQANKLKWNLINSFLVIIMIGTLIEFKVYAGVIVLCSLFLTALVQVFLKKEIIYMKIFLGSLLISLGVFLPQNSHSGDLLVVSPFWFIHSMVDFLDRVGWERLSMARQAYFERGDWIKFLLAEFLAVFMFIVGNLGARFFALLGVVTFVRHKLWKIPEYLFIFWIVLAAAVIPIIFIQKGNPWNTIQFFYYFIYFVALFSGVVGFSIYKKISSFGQIPKYFLFLIIAFVLVITPINAVTTFRSSLYPMPPSRVSLGELEALNFLKDLPDGVVLTYPYNKKLRPSFSDPYPLFAYETTSYVSAFSAKSTYIEDEIQQEILQNNYKKRLVSVNDFFDSKDANWSKQFLLENNIIYIYLPKDLHVFINLADIGTKKVFENSDASILQVIY